ncbi:rhomboid family intramembrane serine protease [bacterium]|nr:rhomboid family intramembrane serine protease [bacterium]
MAVIERITPGVRLVLMLVLMGWVWYALAPSLGGGEWLANVPQRILHGQIWRLLTYPFAAGISASALVSWACFAPFACSVERSLGSVRFRRLFWGSTLLASLLGLLLPGGSPVPGPSIPFLATGTAFCLLNWRHTVYLMMVIPIKVKYLIPLTLVGILTTPPAAWLALCSPLALAYMMVKHNWLMQTELFSKPASRAAAGGRRRSRLSDDFNGPKVTPIRPDLAKAPLSAAETQVDLILDKLRSEGMSSLTGTEKEVLDSHSRRLRHGDERM